MKLTLNTTAKIGKTLSVKREKQDDETEKLVVHLKFGEAVITRDELDQVIGRPVGWSTGCLFDELGAPIAHAVIGLPALELVCTGALKYGGHKNDNLMLGQAILSSIEVALSDKCGLLSGELTWFAAGDETADAESLLGKECGLNVVLTDGGQQDLLKAA